MAPRSRQISATAEATRAANADALAVACAGQPLRAVLWEGLVLAVEPFLSTGAHHADEADDGWTLRTPGSLSAQFEHTIVVTRGDPIVLTV